MTISFLLDTNVFSEPLRPTPNPSILRRLKRHQSELALPAIVWHELLVGCYRLPPSKKRTAIESYLNKVVLPILPYDADAANWHAVQRARLIGEGKTPAFADGQIAAIAAIHRLVLVTLNKSDFLSFDGLTVMDWLS